MYIKCYLTSCECIGSYLHVLMQVDSLEGSTVWYGLATLAVGLVFRLITSFLVVLGANLNIKERIFVALAWLPKATVQVCCEIIAEQVQRPGAFSDFPLKYEIKMSLCLFLFKHSDCTTEMLQFDGICKSSDIW